MFGSFGMRLGTGAAVARSDPYGGKGSSKGGKSLGITGEACQFFMANGWCKYGDACRHSHSGGAGGKGKGSVFGGKGGKGTMFMVGVPSGVSGEPCQFFAKSGWCKYGEQCKHVHVVGAETPVSTGPPKTGEPCQFFQKSGWCKYGDECRHEHIAGPETPIGVVPPKDLGEACQFFSKSGWCQFGDKCKYKHVGAGAAATKSGEPCQFFMKSGWCQYGNSCKHMHVAGEGGIAGGKGGTPVKTNNAPLSPAQYEAAASALINTSGMKQAEAAGLQLTDEAVQALLKIPAHNASELLSTVAEKSATLRDPSNFVVATIARGYVPRK